MIGFVFFIALYWIINRDGRAAKKKKEEDGADPKKTFFTRERLRSEFDGTGPTGKVYLACNDTVFDVTESPHYTKGGSYEAFAGRDISMACAHHSTEEKWLGIDYDPENARLTVDQEQNILMFYMNFCQKYKILGKLTPIDAKKAN